MPDDAKDNECKLSIWEAGNKRYIRHLVMQKHQAQLLSQQAAEQEQERKLKLSRRMLGASFQRQNPHRAAILNRIGVEAGGSNSNSDSDDGGGTMAEHGCSTRNLDLGHSHSQIPKLPSLTDTAEVAACSTAVAIVAPHTEQQRGSCTALPQTAEGATAGTTYPTTRLTFQARLSTTNTRRNQNQLSRSVSARRSGAPQASPYPSDNGAFQSCSPGSYPQIGHPPHPHPIPQHQQQHQTITMRCQTQIQEEHLRSRRRRSTFPVALTKPNRAPAASSADLELQKRHGAADTYEEGPDVATNYQRDKPGRQLLQRQQSWAAQPTHPQAPMLASAARSALRLTSISSLPATPAGYAQWRMRVRVPEGQRTFCISGTGNHSQGIRAGLLARGWYESLDRNSPFFDFKWAANPLDINHDLLWPGQIVNHFRHSSCLTTKHGLCYTVRDTVWYEAADASSFYPRAYDITDEASRREFLDDVRLTAAESLIKHAIMDGEVCSTTKDVSGSPRRKSNGPTGHGGLQPQQQQQPLQQPPPHKATPVGELGTSVGNEVAPAAANGSGAFDGGDDANAVFMLQPRMDSSPKVDLPSLRLACRVVAARLRHQRHLRVVRRTGGSSGTDIDEAASGVELSVAQWQQLVKHQALSCSSPVMPQPQFDPSWVQTRCFITSVLLPPSTMMGRDKHSDGGAKIPNRKGGGADKKSDRDMSKPRDLSGGAGSGCTGIDGEICGGSDAATSDDCGTLGGSPSASASFLGSGHGGQDADVGAEERLGAAAGAVVAVGATGARSKGGPIVVADAAELLREVYGTGQRWPPALPTNERLAVVAAAAAGGSTEAESDVGGGGEMVITTKSVRTSVSLPPLLSDAAATDAGGGGGDNGDSSRGGGGGSGGGISGGGDEVSWLPEDLPTICYDDEALQALDLATWRSAAEAILGSLESSAVQTHISGTNNIWIVKPAGKSRGRGIRLFNDPDALLGYVRGEDAQDLEARWIAQKYVERPLIIYRRKFDIRQWVLVTDWNPLQAWFYSTCYLRFAADDYDPNNLDVFQHLTNNSVSKYYEGAKKDDEITASGNMWSIPRFQKWLAEVYGRDDIWQVLLQPAMRHIAICTLKSAQDHITPRKGSCQLYGYDFLIDDQLRVWLLEVNSSPTLECSTAITTQLCSEVQEDILKVVVDLPEQQQAASRLQARSGGGSESEVPAVSGGDPWVGCSPGGVPAGFDTGKWECIIDGGWELRQADYTGLSLELKGTAIHLPPARSNYAGRLHAATRTTNQQHQSHQHQHEKTVTSRKQQQNQHQQQTLSAAVGHTSDVGVSCSGGGGDNVAVGSSRSVVECASTASCRRSPTRNLPAATTGATCGGSKGAALTRNSRDSVAPSSLSSHCQATSTALHQADRQLAGPEAGVARGDRFEDEAGRVGGSGGGSIVAAAAMSATLSPQLYDSCATTPTSRGGCRASPIRCHTPRLSASPAALSTYSHALWDDGGGGLVLGSFGDPAGSITTLSSGGGVFGGGGGISPLLPSSRAVTPRNDVVVGVAVPSGTAVAAPAVLCLPPSLLHPLESLAPTTVRMALYARPGHHGGSGAVAELVPARVKTR